MGARGGGAGGGCAAAAAAAGGSGGGGARRSGARGSPSGSCGERSAGRAQRHAEKGQRRRLLPSSARSDLRGDDVCSKELQAVHCGIFIATDLAYSSVRKCTELCAVHTVCGSPPLCSLLLPCARVLLLSATQTWLLQGPGGGAWRPELRLPRWCPFAPGRVSPPAPHAVEPREHGGALLAGPVLEVRTPPSPVSPHGKAVSPPNCLPSFRPRLPSEPCVHPAPVGAFFSQAMQCNENIVKWSLTDGYKFCRISEYKNHHLQMSKRYSSLDTNI
ncbi:unnamed protein product [Nyctereutes procyonoides]|uniref:(raccoon dog) hypothetical protein n=1 Tax=Nyctereutes procyonoides TaxID=34880 RepID=A0A811Z0C5_NYCPR|nr:unnamed protein product [Nyctereutes procyonoides]